MGKIKKGILGGFSGRVGNVIGGSWKGIDYMRSEATSIADPKTPKQLEQRSKFRVAVEFAKNCVPLINVGLKQYATKRSEFNYLVSSICKDWWDDANNVIDYASVQLSNSDITIPSLISFELSQTHFVVNYFPVTDPSVDLSVCGLVVDLDDDNFFNIVYPSDFDPTDGNFEILFPTSFRGHHLIAYVFFVDRNTGLCSQTYFCERS